MVFRQLGEKCANLLVPNQICSVQRSQPTSVRSFKSQGITRGFPQGSIKKKAGGAVGG